MEIQFQFNNMLFCTGKLYYVVPSTDELAQTGLELFY